MSNPYRTPEDRIRWLLEHAREAEVRGEADLARTFRAMARDLGPAAVTQVSS